MAAALLVGCTDFSECAIDRSARRFDRPNLGIADDTSARRPELSLRQVRLRNLGAVAGEGVVIIAVTDSIGTALMQMPLLKGAPVRMPPAELGGAEGKIVSISDGAAFDNLVDSLVRTQSRFGLRVRIETRGGDADESDNLRTRQWGRWLTNAPNADLNINFNFTVPHHIRAARVRVEIHPTLARVDLIPPWPRDGRVLRPGRYMEQLKFISPQKLDLGNILVARLSLTDCQTGRVLEEHVQVAVHDTIPPTLSNYRAVLLRDGRIAVHVNAGDQHSGVPEDGVATQYSLDGGKTWHRKVHGFVEDDFERPALFETIVGPFSRHDTILIAVHAHDMVGNVSEQLPADANVFIAPRNAGRLIDSLGVSAPDANPVFTPARVGRLATWVDTMVISSRRVVAQRQQSQPSSAERFELKRLHELRTIPAAFRAHGVDFHGFARATSRPIKLSRDNESERTVFRVMSWQ